MPIRSVRPEHLDRLYADLLATDGKKRTGLAPKTVYDVHVIIRSAFTQAGRQHLVTVNPALAAQPPRSRLRQRSGPNAGPPTNSPRSSLRPDTYGSTPHCTSPPTPACDAANSLDSDGATGKSPPTRGRTVT